MNERTARGEVADDEPEYERDDATEIDAEAEEFEPADPAKVPPDEGDIGRLERPDPLGEDEA